MKKSDRKLKKWKKQIRQATLQELAGGPSLVSQIFRKRPDFVVYKYCPDARERLGSVKFGEIWVSSAEFFSDVFDCSPYVNERDLILLALEGYENRYIDSSDIAKISGMIEDIDEIENTWNGFKSLCGIACFSELDDSLLMWAHYANWNHGMCVEYKLIDLCSLPDTIVLPVRYARKRATINRESVKSPNKLFINAISSKAPCWEYEQE